MGNHSLRQDTEVMRYKCEHCRQETSKRRPPEEDRWTVSWHRERNVPRVCAWSDRKL